VFEFKKQSIKIKRVYPRKMVELEGKKKEISIKAICAFY
jgi:hypothetical protein